MVPDRIHLHGLTVDRVTEAETIATVLAGLDRGRGGHVVPVNLDGLRQLVRQPELAGIFEHASLVVADGMPLLWASRIQGTALPERVAGSDLVWSLCAEAARHGRSVFLLGGAPGAGEAAAARLHTLYPGAIVAEPYSPPVGFEHNPAEIGRLVRALRTADADIVYVALGFPKQERLIAYLRTEFPHTWFLSVGFSLSFLAGEVERAPDWMIRLGLEWVHRLVHDPRRLAKRYLVHDVPFVFRLFARAALARVRREPRTVAAPVRSRELDKRVVFVHGAVERERARLLEDLMRAD